MYSQVLPCPHDSERSHPSRDRWDRFLLGLSSVEENKKLEQHVENCQRCEERLDILQKAEEEFQAIANPRAFVAMLTESKRKLSWFERLQKLLRPIVFAPVVTAALVLLIWIAPWSNQSGVIGPIVTENPSSLHQKNRSFDPAGAIRTKGSPQLVTYIKRSEKWKKSLPQLKFQENDELAFRYRSAGYHYLTMLHIDGKGIVSWIYPSRAAPSIPISSQGELKDKIILDSAKGSEKILTFFSLQPLSAQKVLSFIESTQKSEKHLVLGQKSSSVFVHQTILNK